MGNWAWERVPDGIRNRLKQDMMYAGESREPQNWLADGVKKGLILGLVISMSAGLFAHRPFPVGYILLAPALFLILSYILIYFRIEQRRIQVENCLPDFLQALASNVKAGMPSFLAVKTAAERQGGKFAEELRNLLRMESGTESSSYLIMQVCQRFRSGLLKRTLKILVTAMRSGGRMAPLLETLSREISESNNLKREMVNSTRTYASFILFTVVIGTPLLLAVSSQFLENLQAIQSNIGTTAIEGMSLMSGEVSISPQFLNRISIIMITITALLAGCLMGVISEGKKIYGLRYAIFIVPATLLLFAVFRHIVSGFVGGMV